MTQTAVVTGAEGFLMSFLVSELLANGWRVIGVDSGERYGGMARAFHEHPAYERVTADAGLREVLDPLVRGCEVLVAGAAKVGGVGYFHRYPYDIIAVNERLTLAAVESALAAAASGRLRRLVYVSSSMVYENVPRMPLVEGDERRYPPPTTSYGFQKLAAERIVAAAGEQYALPYTIIRPFNCIGIGEIPETLLRSAVEGDSAWEFAFAHVVPDLIFKAMTRPGPLEILGDGAQVRHFTHGRDLAEGIRLAMSAECALGQTYNIATAESTSIIGLAEKIWRRIRGSEPFEWRSVPGYPHDVQLRIPSVDKAARELNWRARISLDQALDEWVNWATEVVAFRSRGER